MREIRTSGSVGGRGGKPPRPTRRHGSARKAWQAPAKSEPGPPVRDPGGLTPALPDAGSEPGRDPHISRTMVGAVSAAADTGRVIGDLAAPGQVGSGASRPGPGGSPRLA